MDANEMNCRKQIYALGVGHNTPVMTDLAMACGYEIAGLYHYDATRTGETDHGMRIMGSFDDLFRSETLDGKQFLLTMGDLQIRDELHKKIKNLGGETPTLVHPSAVISRFASVSDDGVCVMPFSFIQADTIVGPNTVILSHVNISHTVTIDGNDFIASGAIIGAYTHIRKYVFIGQGALSISGKVDDIGECAFIGAGSLLTKNVPAGTTVCGRPARNYTKK